MACVRNHMDSMTFTNFMSLLKENCTRKEPVLQRNVGLDKPL